MCQLQSSATEVTEMQIDVSDVVLFQTLVRIYAYGKHYQRKCLFSCVKTSYMSCHPMYDMLCHPFPFPGLVGTLTVFRIELVFFLKVG